MARSRFLFSHFPKATIIKDQGPHFSFSRKVKENHIKEPGDCKQFLIDSIKEQMKVEETAYRFETEKHQDLSLIFWILFHQGVL